MSIGLNPVRLTERRAISAGDAEQAASEQVSPGDVKAEPDSEEILNDEGAGDHEEARIQIG